MCTAFQASNKSLALECEAAVVKLAVVQSARAKLLKEVSSGSCIYGSEYKSATIYAAATHCKGTTQSLVGIEGLACSLDIKVSQVQEKDKKIQQRIQDLHVSYVAYNLDIHTHSFDVLRLSCFHYDCWELRTQTATFTFYRQ